MGPVYSITCLNNHWHGTVVHDPVNEPKEHVMANISIIGTGNMGQAIAAVAGRGGHTVHLLGRGDLGTDLGDVVVLAVPYAAVTDVTAAVGQRLAGKVVVDITNPVNFETFDGLTVAADSSAAAEIAAALPDAKVLKAFNTNFASTLAGGTVGDLPTTVLIAGDDADAKSLLAGIVTSGGLRAIDAGALARARELEALGFLQITLAAGEKVPWTAGFGVVS
jgi:8-hydroxy-5-deazaflavin:NADPH oxidoreductase